MRNDLSAAGLQIVMMPLHVPDKPIFIGQLGSFALAILPLGHCEGPR